MRKYEFKPELIGDIEEGRPNLGTKVDLEIYRLMQFTLRDVLEKELGTETTDKLFFEAGKLAGKNFFEKYIAPVNSLEEFISITQKRLKDKGIGILRIEEDKINEGKVMLTIDEDVDCSGLPELDYETCIYDEGFVSAIFEGYTKENWSAKEIDCWCTGARTCRFLVTKDDIK